MHAMVLFLLGIVLLAAGYMTYGRFIEKMIAPDDRETPAITKFDGVDYVCLPHWKNMLIQLLNIAGVGPVIGVILGIKFGTIVFVVIPIGNVIAGATHDFISGMMSVRHGGANLPALVKMNLGKRFYGIFSVFMMLLLLLVVAVFVNIPAQIIDSMMPEVPIFWFAVVGIFLYYICSTIFPIDKIIGKIYPAFGALLLVGTVAVCIAVVAYAMRDPSVLTETAGFKEKMWTAENGHPIVPLLFVTIACGIISGFHATQSPIIARTMKSERQGRAAFYGMMIVEGVIAMIWAAAGLAIYNLFPEKMDENATWVLSDIAKYFLGDWVGSVTLLGVVILAITSGDTAMRSLRMSLAEMIGMPQKKLSKRIILCTPLIILVSLLLAWSNVSASSFAQLWNYFAWGNQVLASATLSASAVWLYRQGKSGGVALIPAMFMTFIVISYILWISPAHGGPVGFGLDLNVSYAIAAILTIVLAYVVRKLGAAGGKPCE